MYITKEQEIQILREAAEKLGPSSYCGPWLSHTIDEIERDIRSDFYPQIDLATARKRCEEEIQRCQAQCKALLADAEKRARAQVEEARAEACRVRGRILQELRNVQRELGVAA